jgi:hypothetical protein
VAATDWPRWASTAARTAAWVCAAPSTTRPSVASAIGTINRRRIECSRPDRVCALT